MRLGQGDFVEALFPEAVYESSVIWTDYDGWAYLTINGEAHEVGPSSTTPVASFISERRRTRGGGFFSRVFRELTRSLAPPEQDEIVAGGRASEVATATADPWALEVDPDVAYAKALDFIDAEDYESAVDALRSIEIGFDDHEFEIEEYYVQLAYALIGMGDFHAGMAASFEYAVADPSPSNVDLLPYRLRFLGGVAAYYAEADEVALASLGSYIEEVSLENADVEAVALRYLLLRDSGRNSEAYRLLRDARRVRPGVDWDAAISL
jgi:tetratricopeptide (TPR) repeat protein